MSHPIRFYFKCPDCGKEYESRDYENFSTFADRVFQVHTWDHLDPEARRIMRQTWTTPGVYCQRKDGG